MVSVTLAVSFKGPPRSEADSLQIGLTELDKRVLFIATPSWNKRQPLRHMFPGDTLPATGFEIQGEGAIRLIPLCY